MSMGIPATRRARTVFTLIAVTMMVAMTNAPQVHAQERATVGVAHLDGRGDGSIQAVVETVIDTLETVIAMTGRFTSSVLDEVVPGDTASLREASDLDGLDNVITGEVVSLADGQIGINLLVYNRAEDAVTVRVRQEAETLFSVFDAVDRAVVDLLEGLTGHPVEFGSIAISGDWNGQSDEVLLDGRVYDAPGGRVSNVLAREYELVVRRSGVGPVLTETIRVTADATTTVAVPIFEVTTGAIEVRRGTLPPEQVLFPPPAGVGGAFDGIADGDDPDSTRAIGATDWTTPPPPNAATEGNAVTLGHDLSGELLPVYGFSPAYERVAEAFSAETGIDIELIPPEEQDWRVDITLARDTPPEVIRLSQPGPIFDLISLGLMEDTFRGTDRDLVVSRIPSRFVGLATRDGRSAGIPVMLSLKNLYWYSPALFERLGLSVPTTAAELDELIATFSSERVIPYGFAIESGEIATGWPFTDWVEDRILQGYPVEVYDEWARGRLGFRGTVVDEEITELTYALRDEAVTFGGEQRVLETPFYGAVELLLQEPPKVGLVFAPSFVASWYSDDLNRLDFFPSPPTEAFMQRVLVGGDIIALATASPEARAFLRYVTRRETAGTLIENSGRGNVATHSGIAIERLYEPFELRVARMIQEAAVVRYDGSDSMTRAVGMDLFLTAGRTLMKGSAIRGTLVDIDEARRGR